MRTYYIADVSLEPNLTSPIRGPVAKKAAKVLKVKLMAYSDRSELSFQTDLYGHETVFIWQPDGNALPEVKEHLKEIEKDLVEQVIGHDQLRRGWGILKDEELDKLVEEFEIRWKRRAFGHALKAYDITKRLTLEQAKCVLEEHYVVEPIMES